MKKQQDTWVICPECKTKLKKENITAHLKHIHDKTIEDVDESSIKALPKKVQKQKKSMNFSIITIAIILVIFVVIIAAAFFILSGSSDDSNNNGVNGNSGNPDWLDDYTPVYSLGTGENNFWIKYPEKLSKSGDEVNHPQWVLDELENNPILIVAGSDNCVPCITQKRNINTVLETYGDQILFFNLPVDGSDPRAWDAYNAYWSQETSWYIPFTAILTKSRDTDNQEAVYWHSSTGSTGEQWISDFVKDAVYYHHIYQESS